MQRVPAILATMLGHTGLQNANLVVDNLPSNGTTFHLNFNITSLSSGKLYSLNRLCEKTTYPSMQITEPLCFCGVSNSGMTCVHKLLHKYLYKIKK